MHTREILYVSCVLVTHRKKHARNTEKEDVEKETTPRRKVKAAFRHGWSAKETLEIVPRWRIREPVRSY